jgi:FkbM family methyltransferase
VANCKPFPRIQCFNKAVTNRIGTMYVSTPGLSISATVRPTKRLQNCAEDYYRPVTTVALGTLLLKHNPSTVKLDIEGSEYDAIANTTKSEWNGVKNLYIEFHGTRSPEKWAATRMSLEQIARYTDLGIKRAPNMSFTDEGGTRGLYFDMLLARDSPQKIGAWLKGMP